MKTIDFMSNKRYFFALSLFLTFIGIIFFLINGIQLDIQFQGGSLIKIEMPDDKFDTARAEELVKTSIGKKATAQKLTNLLANNKQQHMLLINIANKEALDANEINKVVADIRKTFSVKESANMSVDNVEPFFGNELKNRAMQAIFIASILMVLYIWWRFKSMGLSAGVTAVIALVHDAAIMLMAYIIFKLPINDSFVAAILTILGYSINDTVIIYDRIRENKAMLRKISVSELANRSINQTLTRSINTVVTVLICVIVLLIFGTVYNIQSIKEFSLPLLIGLSSGTYSSVCIASPLWVWYKEKQQRKKIASKPAKA